MVKPLTVPNPKVTMKFDMAPQGWTESHIYTSVVPLTDPGLYAAMKALGKARCAALDGRYAQLVAVRASLDNVNRDVTNLLTQDIDVPGVTGYNQGPPTQSTDWVYNGPQAAWPVKLLTNNPTTNPLEYITIGSLPPSQTGRQANNAGGQNVLYYINKYLVELCNGNWGALGRNWSVPGTAFLNANITYIAAAGQNPPMLSFLLTAPFPPNTTFPTGSLFRLEGATYTTPQSRLRLNGTYTVLLYNPTTGVLVTQIPRLLAAPVFSALGAVTPATASVYPYRAGIVRPITHRKRGRPLDAARGRK